jgi:hypothetical protein
MENGLELGSFVEVMDFFGAKISKETQGGSNTEYNLELRYK